MSRVFMANIPTKMAPGGDIVNQMDLSPVDKYGEMISLLPGGDAMLSPQPWVTTLHNRLRNFSNDDYILPVGDTVGIGMVMAIAASHNNGKVKVLRWNRKHYDYDVVEVKLW